MSKEVLHHSCVVGLLTDAMVKIIGQDGKDWIGEVNYILGEGTSRSYHIQGRLIMIEATTYDMVVFSLLREMYGMPFPQLLIASYTSLVGHLLPACADINHQLSLGTKMIVTRQFHDRALKEEDYWPYTSENLEFRYNLCLLVFFCKFVGCPLSLRQIRVLNGVPFFWRASSIGHPKAPTISSEEFATLFGVDIATARVIYDAPHLDRDYVSNAEPRSNSELTSLIRPNVDYEKHVKGTMFDRVVKYFRGMDFDKDTVRECIYIRENPVRSAVGNRKTFALSRTPRQIEAVLEENFSLLNGAYPFRIFRSD